MTALTRMPSVNNRGVFVFFLAVLWMSLSSCHKNLSEPENAARALDVPYGDNQNMNIYYFSPCNEKKPVLIFVHGGSWYAGDKSDWSTAHADLFLENDIINVSVNYGLTPHPTQINDVAKAVRWVYDNIDLGVKYNIMYDSLSWIRKYGFDTVLSIGGDMYTLGTNNGYNENLPRFCGKLLVNSLADKMDV